MKATGPLIFSATSVMRAGRFRRILEPDGAARGDVMVDEFVAPDWTEPLDLEGRLQDVPAHKTVKGIAFASLIAAATEATGHAPPGFGPYVAFKDYPTGEMLRLCAAVARVAHPDVSEREGIRRLGHRGYRAIVGSMFSKVLLALGGRSWAGALGVVGKIYGAVARNDVRTEVLGDGHALVVLRDVWSFPDVYHVGVFEEGMRHYGLEGQVRVRRHSRCDVDLELRWSGAWKPPA